MNNNDFYPYPDSYSSAIQAENEMSLSNYVARVMRRVYGKMFLGLLATALTSFAVLTSGSLMAMLMSHPAVFWVLMFVELGLVLAIGAAIDKLSTGTATALFYLYSVVNGLVLTPIFLVYTLSSIAYTFAITSLTFGAMTIFGYVTKQDLTKFGAILFMALIGLIICVVVNLFLHSTAMEWFISIAGVLIFIGLTAWDTQKIKKMAAMADQSQVGKVATLGALSLYLDFINLFLYLLRFFGSRE
ncbi:MAG: Bax inhibitor-1/YccA family protein [Muribaculaceae bacterium]|nr:Bax inhibitor-1/YccA family protein [Muribaculaceae bacterium]